MAWRLALKQTVLVVTSTMQQIHVQVFDDEDEPADPVDLSLQLLDSSGEIILTGSISAPGDSPIQRVEKGNYRFTFNSANEDFNPLGDYVAIWSALPTNNSDTLVESATIKVISIKMLRFVHLLRGQIDKMRKAVNDDPEDLCPLGYTDAGLVNALELGVARINEYQPYPMWTGVDEFPEINKALLIDSALVAGITAQQLFAVDADIEGYSDNGQVFTINHQPKLAAVLNQLVADLNVRIPAMKQHYISVGSVSVQVGPHARYATLTSAGPVGAGFRNIFFGAG